MVCLVNVAGLITGLMQLTVWLTHYEVYLLWMRAVVFTLSMFDEPCLNLMLLPAPGGSADGWFNSKRTWGVYILQNVCAPRLKMLAPCSVSMFTSEDTWHFWLWWQLSSKCLYQKETEQWTCRQNAVLSLVAWSHWWLSGAEPKDATVPRSGCT